MSIAGRRVYQRLTNLTFALVLVIGAVAATLPFVFSQTVSALASVSSQAELEVALAGSDTDIALDSSFSTTSQITISRSVTIHGNGHTISPTFARTDNSNNVAIGINGTSNVTIENLKVDGAAGTNLHGIQAFQSTDVVLNNITSVNNDRTGIGVNGSTVTVTNVHTAGNGWHGLNVDQGSGVTSPATLTVNGISQHFETVPDIYVDYTTKPDVSVIDTGNQYNTLSIGLGGRPDLAYFIKPAAPVITTPLAEQYFTSTPILNKWSKVDYTRGISQYQIKYEYDDGHSFSGAPYRYVDSPATSRNHTPTIGEQGGVTIWVRAIDTLGLYGHWSAPVHYTYDATAPVAPSLVSPSNGAVVKGASVTQAWATTDDDVDHYIYESYHDAAATNLRWHEEISATSKTATNVANATYWWRVKAVDHAGNVGPWSELWKLSVDNDAPVIAITHPTNGSVFNGSVEVRGSMHDANPRHYWLNITRNGATIVSRTVLSGNFTNALLETLTQDGVYKVTFAARDAVGGGADTGNRSADVVVNFTIDTTAPDAPVLTVPGLNSGDATNSYTVEATWTAPEGAATYDYKYWNDIPTSAYNSESSAWIAAGLTGTSRVGEFNQGEGTHYLQVRAIDAAGNVSDWSNTFVITYDATGPNLNITGSTSATATPTISGTVTGDEDGVVTITFNGITTTVGADGSGNWSYTSPDALPNGSYPFSATVTDAAGNEVTQTADVTVAVVIVTPDDPETPEVDETESEVQTVVTPIITPPSENNDEGVQGATDENDDDQGTQGAAIETPAQIDTDASDGSFFGLAWYWWIAILAALTALIWGIAAALRRRQEA